MHIPEASEVFNWRYYPVKDDINSGVQIDLIFDRPDNIINLCEIKYCSSPFALDKKYAQKLHYRAEIYRKVTGVKKHIFHSLIVADGLKRTVQSDEIISSFATLNDLFKT